MKISRSPQACALGAAIFGAVAGGVYNDTGSAQKRMAGVKSKVYKPNKAHARAYAELYAMYKDMHDAFGTPRFRGKLNGAMKKLIGIRDRARKG
jgi:L-ribulokinase